MMEQNGARVRLLKGMGVESQKWRMDCVIKFLASLLGNDMCDVCDARMDNNGEDSYESRECPRRRVS